MIKKKDLLERIRELENDLEHTRYATKKIVELINGGTLTYYGYSSPSICGDYHPGCISQRIKAICEYLGIVLQHPEITVQKPGVTAVKKKVGEEK